MTLREAVLALLLLLAAAPVWAHEQSGQAAGVLTGLQHPVSGLDHVLAMISVGLWGAQLGHPAVWILPVVFPMVMAFGGFLGLMGVLTLVVGGIAVSAILLGLMGALEARPPLWVAAGLVGFGGIFHGYAHGTELPAGENALLYSVGFVIATGCLHGVGIGIGVAHRWSAGRIALRLAGAVVALAGVYFLWGALA